jgi:hypothetical protein
VDLTNDPASPAFWDSRFTDRRIAWDAGRSPAELARYLAGHGPPARVLVPGCGSAYEVRTFAEAGCEVQAIDFSSAAVERAQALLGNWRHLVTLADFFACDCDHKPFDIVYERAFLASLPRSLWPVYARRVAELLRRGGRLIGFFLYGDQSGGPPFCLRAGELAELLGGSFDRIAESAVSESVPVFAGKERWEVWVRSG